MKNDIIEMRKQGKSTFIPVRDDDLPVLRDENIDLLMQPKADPAISEQLHGSYRDRAIGFSIKTWQVSFIVGLVAWLVGGSILTSHPLLSLGALAWLISGFLVVWIISFALDLLFSPSGVELYRAHKMFEYLAREQKERHEHYRK